MPVALEPPDQPAVLALIAELDAYQASLYPPEACYALDISALRQPNVVFVVARDTAGQAVGCGAVVVDADGDSGELKRMYLRPGSRGQGAAQQMLALLEQHAALRGCRRILLETGPYQAQALAFYQRQGYARRGPFGSYPDHPLSVFMDKPLPAVQAPAGARLFTVAYPAFAPAVQARIDALRAQHDPQHGLLGAHITLEFGQASQPPAAYTSAVEGVARQQRGVAIGIAGLQHWPGPDGAHHLFLTLDPGAAALQGLQADLAQALALPAAPQDCPPHITVGRFASAAAARAALAGCQPSLPLLLGATARIQTLVVGALHGAAFTHLRHLPLRA